MRRLAGEVARLWVARREELGHPLGVVSPLPPAAAFAGTPAGDAPRTLVFEVGTEEMPPSEARSAVQQVQRELTDRLGGTRLAHGDVRVLATPRRLIAVVTEVAAREPDHERTVKGPKVRRARRRPSPGSRAPRACRWSRWRPPTSTAYRIWSCGSTKRAAPHRPCSPTCSRRVAGSLRAAKNMRWNDPQLAFTRPIRWLRRALGRRDRAGRGLGAAGRPGDPGAAHRRPAGGQRRLGGDLHGDAGDQRDRRRRRGPPRADRHRRRRTWSGTPAGSTWRARAR